MLPDLYSPPTEQELADMEMQYAMERAIREALDEEQALRETKGGMD